MAHGTPPLFELGSPGPWVITVVNFAPIHANMTGEFCLSLDTLTSIVFDP